MVFYDLQGDSHMSPIVGMLYAAVRENNQRLQSIVNGMSQEEVDYKGPDCQSNSTAQLIRHITYVDLNWVYRIKGESLPHALQQQYGSMIDANNRLPMVEGMSLHDLISGYDDVMQMLKATCVQLNEGDLARVVTFGHEHEKQATIRWGLWHMADHSRYHQAHINLLRKWYREIERSVIVG